MLNEPLFILPYICLMFVYCVVLSVARRLYVGPGRMNGPSTGHCCCWCTVTSAIVCVVLWAFMRLLFTNTVWYLRLFSSLHCTAVFNGHFMMATTRDKRAGETLTVCCASPLSPRHTHTRRQSVRGTGKAFVSFYRTLWSVTYVFGPGRMRSGVTHKRRWMSTMTAANGDQQSNIIIR